MISGAFSLTRQAIQLGYLPRMTIVHTSDKHIGQIYIPFINWMLFLFVYVLVLTFQTSGNLAHAYGVAVTGKYADYHSLARRGDDPSLELEQENHLSGHIGLFC